MTILAIAIWLSAANGRAKQTEARPSYPKASSSAPSAAKVPEGAPERLVPRVVAVYPHDPEAFTQGLVWHEGFLYESTGLYGRSTLRRVDLTTGAVLRSAEVPALLFGEGLARVGDRLIQLTWQEEVALVWGLETLERRGDYRYKGEGWGLCFDGKRLVMSDGSGRLTWRDPKSFAEVGKLAVTVAGRPAERLNELECVEGAVYANVWGSDQILRIDAASGRATAVIEAGDLLTPRERTAADVLNGIAYRAEADTFLLTGKLWPKLFEVVFEAAPRRSGKWRAQRPAATKTPVAPGRRAGRSPMSPCRPARSSASAPRPSAGSRAARGRGRSPAPLRG
jgi:glutaminyl-peptide cyclotransferase